MKRVSILSLFVVLLAIGYGSANSNTAVSGQGMMKFKVLYRSDHLPPQAQEVLKGAHGGFSVDLRDDKGETYFALKGAGIIQISADLKSTRMVDTAEEMRTLISTTPRSGMPRTGSPICCFRGNEANKVFVTGLDGKLDAVLTTPEVGVDLGNAAPNDISSRTESSCPLTSNSWKVSFTSPQAIRN